MNVSRLIETILSKKEICRNSDRHLIVAVWQALGLALNEKQIEMLTDELPTAETIRRVRQKLQEEGKYPATKKIRNHRQFSGLVVKQNMPKTKADKIPDLVTRAPDWFSRRYNYEDKS